MTQVTLPEIGDGIESGDILDIFVSVGDVISKGQDIVEMETDKATVPVPSSHAGKVTKILVSEGDTVPIGGAILEVEAASSSAAAAEPTSPQPQESADPPAEPELEPTPVAESTTNTPEPEPVREQRPSQPAESPAKTEPVAPEAEPQPVATASQSVIAAGPAVRRFAREVGVDLSNVTGSGSHGRITRDDVLAVVRTAGKTSRAPAKPKPATDADSTTAQLPGDPSSGRLRTNSH